MLELFYYEIVGVGGSEEGEWCREKLLVVLCRGRVVGIVSCRFSVSVDSFLFLVSIFVLSSFFRMGVGVGSVVFKGSFCWSFGEIF